MSLAFLYAPDVLGHDTGPDHPERPARLSHLVSHLMGTDLWGRMKHLIPDEARREHLLRVHPERYVSWVAASVLEGRTLLDSGDTRISAGSWRAALLAAGGALLAVDLACGSNVTHAFSAARPPGHHAETSKAMGFCLFNNVAIAARYAQAVYGVGKVAIVDWDVHHGNGTQEIFWEDPSVLYISTHQFPLWPGTGAASETGGGKGKGFTLNCPMRPGSGEREYVRVFEETILPALRLFGPDMLMISAGFDAHRADPLANINLETSSYDTLTRMVLNEAVRDGGPGVVSILEGGYDLDALAESTEGHLRALLGVDSPLEAS